MGIKGLATFMQRRGDCFENAILHNTTVIVDGFNILHEIYYNGQSETVYGGDYDVFGKEAFYFIHKIRKASIEPIFIFDGTDPLDGKKFDTTLSRAQERCHLVNLALHRRRAKVLPILAYRVFIEVLREQNVQFCVADFEADDELFVLANKMNCPLISNDSDFMLMPLPAGLIQVGDFDPSSLTKIADEEAEDGERFVMPVRIYRHEKLMNVFKIRHASLLPVLALICGNDSFSPNKLHEFRRGFATAKGKDMPNIDSILKWLSKFKTVDQAINKILESCSNKGLRREMSKVLQTYNRKDSDIERFFQDGTITHRTSPDHYIFKILDENVWKQVRTGLISKKILTTLVHGRHILYAQMEDINSMSAWRASRDIRKACYKIVCKTSEGRLSVVTEYERTRLYMKQRVVLDMAYETEPCLSLEEIRKLSPPVLERWFVQQLTGSNRMIPDELKQQADSIQFNDVEFITSMLVHWINMAEPKVNNLNSLDLLSLLNLKLTCSLRRLISARYMYNLVIELIQRSNPLLYCQELLERSSTYSQFFTSWFQAVEQLVGENRLLIIQNTNATHSKKTKRSAKPPTSPTKLKHRKSDQTENQPSTSHEREKAPSSDKQEVTSSEDESDNDMDTSLADQYGGNNKFSTLMNC